MSYESAGSFVSVLCGLWSFAQRPGLDSFSGGLRGDGHDADGFEVFLRKRPQRVTTGQVNRQSEQ